MSRDTKMLICRAGMAEYGTETVSRDTEAVRGARAIGILLLAKPVSRDTIWRSAGAQ